MRVEHTSLDGVLILKPKRFVDDRGFFSETFSQELYDHAGVCGPFIQDNFSNSKRHVLRGLHFQRRQAKLVSVVRGEVFDVVVDIRPNSNQFGAWEGTHLSRDNGKQLYLPAGFAHGFCVLSEEADVWYKTSDIYRPKEEGGLRWNDKKINIDWPISSPILSARDQTHPSLEDLDLSQLITR